MVAEQPDLARVVPRGADGAAIAAAILADAADPEGTADRVGRARLFALDRLSPSRSAAAWSALLAEVAGAPTRPAPAPAAALDRVARCPHRRTEQGCCGPLDRCHGPRSPHRGRPVMTAQCIGCVEIGGDVA
jgi:hypothetical protein